MSDENNNGVQSPAVIDAACRMPVLLLFGSALAWLVLALVLGFLATMNFHMPALLADCPWFTYGHRVSAAHAAFMFGFGGNAALGITLWMLSRLRGMPLARPGFGHCGAISAQLRGVLRGFRRAVVGALLQERLRLRWALPITGVYPQGAP